MPSAVRYKGRDFNGELTSFGVLIPDVDAANFDASATLVNTTILDAINGVSVDSPFTGRALLAIDVPVAGQSGNPLAQREAKWRVSYIDNLNPIGDGSFEIGMPDLTLMAAGEGGELDVSGGTPGATLVAVIETNLVSRLGNPVTVQSIKHVGRNT